MASLPSLVVNLALNSVEFIAGLTKAQYETKKAVEGVKQSIESIKTVVTEVAAVLGVGLGVHAFEEMIKGAIEAEAELERLGKRAGLTGEQMSSLILPARLAHTDLETLAQASARISKAFVNFGNDTAPATQALKILGITAKDIPALLANPIVGLQTVAKGLASLGEGGGKAAAQLIIVGRAGGASAAALDELAKTTELHARRTEKEILAAKELEERFIKLDLAMQGLKTTFANALIEPISAVLDAFAELTSGTNNAKSALGSLVADGSIQKWSLAVIEAIAGIVDALVTFVVIARSAFKNVEVAALGFGAVLQGGLAGKYGFQPEVAAKAVEAYHKAQKELEVIDAAAARSFANLMETNAHTFEGAIILAAKRRSEAFAEGPSNFHQNADRAADAAANAKRIADARNAALQHIGDKKDTSDPAKARLEGEIKAQELAIALQRDLLNTQREFLRAYYDADLITINNYYDSLQAARETALEKTIAAYDAEIAAARTYQKNAKTEADKQKAQNTVDEATLKQQKVITDSVNLEKLQSLERTKALQKYSDELDGIKIQLLQVQGFSVQAAAIQFDIANRSNVTRAARNGDEQTLRIIAALRQQTIVQAGLNEINKQYDLILGDIAVQQGYINIAQTTGRISQTEALQKQSDLNKAMIPYLQAIADSYAQIAEKSGLAQDILKAQQMKLAVEQLRAQTDLLADSFNKTFGDAFASALSDVITHTKSLKDAFNDMVKSITKSISDIASKNISTALFGQEGPLAGIGQGFAKLFGGGSKSQNVDTTAAASAATKAIGTSQETLTAIATLTTSASSLDGSAITLQSAGVALESAATALTGAASSLASSAGVSSASSGGGGLFGLFGKLFSSSPPSGVGPGDTGGGPGYYASGTDYSRGGYAMVGEHGPEFVNLPEGSQVFRSGAKPGRHTNLSIVVNVPQGTSGASADQIGVRVGSHVQRVLARNG